MLLVSKRSCKFLALIGLLALGGCKSVSLDDVTGSINAPPPAAMSSEAQRANSERLRDRYEANPGDKAIAIAIAYARTLPARDLNDQAVAVLQNVAIKAPNDREVLAAYGKALADAGRLPEAQSVLDQADTPDNPNWSVVPTKASIDDQLGDHATAQAQYETALKLVPGEPSILSNLGLSYALSRKLPQAENVLREAVASPAQSSIRDMLWGGPPSLLPGEHRVLAPAFF